MLIKNCFAEPPESDEWFESELRDEEVWKLSKALHGYRKSPKLWHQHVFKSLGKSELPSTLSCFRNDDMNTNFFIHVDDGFTVWPESRSFFD